MLERIRNVLIDDIKKNYYYERWKHDSKKNINAIPQGLQMFYFQLGAIIVFKARNQHEAVEQVKEIFLIRKELKKFYRKEIRKYV